MCAPKACLQLPARAWDGNVSANCHVLQGVSTRTLCRYDPRCTSLVLFGVRVQRWFPLEMHKPGSWSHRYPKHTQSHSGFQQPTRHPNVLHVQRAVSATRDVNDAGGKDGPVKLRLGTPGK